MVDDFIVRAIFEEELGLRYKSPRDEDYVLAVEAPRGGVAITVSGLTKALRSLGRRRRRGSPEIAALASGLLRRLLAETGTVKRTKL